jgi:hypothetical protein
MKDTELGKDVLPIMTGVFVTLPCVNGVAARGRARAENGLAECSVGNTVVRSEFDDRRRIANRREPKGKGHMRPPRARHANSLRPQEKGRETGRKDRFEAFVHELIPARAKPGDIKSACISNMRPRPARIADRSPADKAPRDPSRRGALHRGERAMQPRYQGRSIARRRRARGCNSP